jgi:tetratricopeptide (TPR) repeat protein
MMLAFQRRIFVAFRDAFTVAALALLAPATEGADAGGRGFDPREIYLLPSYCKYTQIYRDNLPGGKDPAEIERLTNSMGHTFIHMHHYCWALQTSNPARLAADAPDIRRHDLLLAIGDFDYVIERAPKDFSLLPEIHTKKGEALIRMNRAAEGILEFQRAIKLKADYWQAYAAMSDYYKETGQPAKAREALDQGLSVAPNAKALKVRLADLHAPKGKR